MKHCTYPIDMQIDKLKSKCEKFGINVPENFYEKINLYVQSIIEHNPTFGLIGAGEIENIYQRHIADSLSILLFSDIDNLYILDFGSGGGLPGMVLAIARPQAKFILAESSQKKSQFLQLCVDTLGLKNVNIYPGRAKNIFEKFDVITLRATGPLTRTISQSIKLLRQPGKLALWAGEKIYSKIDYWKNFGLNF